MARRNNKGSKGKKERVPEWQQRESEKRVVRDKKRSGKRAVARPEAGEASVGKSKRNLKQQALPLTWSAPSSEKCKTAKISDHYFNGYNTGIRLS